MLLKFESAVRERYQRTHQQMYGFKDEERTMKIMKSNIHSILSNYSSHGHTIKKPKASTNPLAAVFAL